jgi:uncharacterized membrane protein
MSFSLVKAMKSTHRHPLNKTFHLIGLSLYVFALFTLISHLIVDHGQNPMLGLTLWLTAINLFFAGHTIENNVGAMTIIVLLKYFRSQLHRNRLNRLSTLVASH